MSKELKVRYVVAENLYEVFYEGGGQVPDSLLGLYTSEVKAKEAISLFQSTVRDRVERNGKASRGSGVQ